MKIIIKQKGNVTFFESEKITTNVQNISRKDINQNSSDHDNDVNNVFDNFIIIIINGKIKINILMLVSVVIVAIVITRRLPNETSVFF